MAIRIQDYKKASAGRPRVYAELTVEVPGALGLRRRGFFSAPSRPILDTWVISFLMPVQSMHLSYPCLACLTPHLSVHLVPLLPLTLSVCPSPLCLSLSFPVCNFPCPSSYLHPIPSSIPSYPSHPSLLIPALIFSICPFVPLPSTSPSLPLSLPLTPLSSTFLLTPWSASLLARERLGVKRPRREPTGLGSWL